LTVEIKEINHFDN